MNETPTAATAQRSLSEHVVAKGAELQAKYGPQIGWQQLQQVLQDRSLVRYPCEIAFTTEGLHEGEFAYTHALGDAPEDGFIIRIHPHYMTELGLVPQLVLYHLVTVNYGEFASSDDAEAFGAAALGMEPEDYYNSVCRLADQLDGCGCG